MQKKFFLIPPANVTGCLHAGHIMELQLINLFAKIFDLLGVANEFVFGLDYAGSSARCKFVRLKKNHKLDGYMADLKEKICFLTNKLDPQQMHQFRTTTDAFKHVLQAELQQTREREMFDFVLLHSLYIVVQTIFFSEIKFDRINFTADRNNLICRTEVLRKLCGDNRLYCAKQLMFFCSQCDRCLSNRMIRKKEKRVTMYEIQYKLVGKNCKKIRTLRVCTTSLNTVYDDRAIVTNQIEYDDDFAINPVNNSLIPVVFDRWNFVKHNVGSGNVKITPKHSVVDFVFYKNKLLPYLLKKNEYSDCFFSFFLNFQLRSPINRCDSNVVAHKQTAFLSSVDFCGQCDNVASLRMFDNVYIRYRKILEKFHVAIKNSINKKNHRFFNAATTADVLDWCVTRNDSYLIQQKFLICQKCFVVRYAHEQTQTNEPVCAVCGCDVFAERIFFLDTWFSSACYGLQIRKQHNANKMIVAHGYDIFSFWTLKMIVMEFYMNRTNSFENVVVHGLIRDENAEKFSKSKGNFPDLNEICDVDEKNDFFKGKCKNFLLYQCAGRNDISLRRNCENLHKHHIYTYNKGSIFNKPHFFLIINVIVKIVFIYISNI